MSRGSQEEVLLKSIVCRVKGTQIKTQPHHVGESLELSFCICEMG